MEYKNTIMENSPFIKNFRDFKDFRDCKDFSKDFKNYPRKPTRAGTIIINYETKQLLITQSYGRHWGLPKGHLEKNENSIDCALRETLEETGIKLNIHDLKERKSIYNGDAIYYLVDGTKLNFNRENIDTQEISDVCWMYFDSLKEKFKNKEIIINSHLKTLLPYIQKVIKNGNVLFID